MESLSMAKDNMLEWWFIFRQTGNIEDARMLVEAIREYDLFLQDEEERDL